jgi:hypothetical protein
MKLRLRHNSIRFRLTQSDVGSIRRSGRCRETILFPGGSRLEYVLLASNTKEVGVVFADGIISVAIPARQLTDWHSSDRVGISAAVDVYQSDVYQSDVQSGTKLEVLIEKDFRCLGVRPRNILRIPGGVVQEDLMWDAT